MNLEIKETFGNRIRLRVCGILLRDDAILLAEHHGIGPAGTLWIPPGGGVETGESLRQALVREFLEETGIHVKVERLLTINEFISMPLHAIEFFFIVTADNALKPVKGSDPELKENQILGQVKFVTFNELSVMEDETKHQILRGIDSEKALLNLDGDFKFSR